MDDAFGNQLSVGDYVLYADTGDRSSLFIARVEKINPKTVRILITEGGWRVGRTSTIGPNRVALAESIQSPEEIHRNRERIIRDTLTNQMSDYILGVEDYKAKAVVLAIKTLRAKGMNKEAIQQWFETANHGLDNQYPVSYIGESTMHRGVLHSRVSKAADAVVVNV